MHTRSLSLLLSLFPLPFAQAQDVPDATPAPEVHNEHPTPTAAADGVPGPQNGAIKPTATGQIGINPVDLPQISYASPGYHV